MRRESWIDPRIEGRSSPIEGRGLFARAPIRTGEVVVIWGGTVLTGEELAAGQAYGQVRRHSVTAIAEGRYLVWTIDEAPSPDDFMNHSCDPNLGMADEVTLIARRDIAAGDELTADYAMWEADEDWVAGWPCHCETARCRGRLAGTDWQRPELQARYGRHFSPFLLARIRRGIA